MSRNKLIIILLLSLSSVVAQNIIIGISPSVICDTTCATVNFKYNSKCRLPQQPTTTLQPMSIEIIGTEIIISKQYLSFDKKLNGFDTIYSFDLCLPELNIGKYFVKAVGYCSTAFLGGLQEFDLEVTECGVVGLKEIEMDLIDVKYYDLNGKEIPFTLNKIIIKRVGNKYTKIFVNG